MNKKDLFVGQKVYLKPVGEAIRYGPKPVEEYEIKSIGNKYFFVWKGEDYTIKKFTIEDLKEAIEYNSMWELYFSLQEIKNQEEKENLYRKIRINYFLICDGGKNTKLSLNQLRKIWEVVNNEN